MLVGACGNEEADANDVADADTIGKRTHDKLVEGVHQAVDKQQVDYPELVEAALILQASHGTAQVLAAWIETGVAEPGDGEEAGAHELVSVAQAGGPPCHEAV